MKLDHLWHPVPGSRHLTRLAVWFILSIAFAVELFVHYGDALFTR